MVEYVFLIYYVELLTEDVDLKRMIVILFIISVLLCSCDAGYSRYSAGASEFNDALSVIQMVVPYTGGMDLRLDTINLLETDSYGRNLFYYYLTVSRMGVLLIVQDTQDPLVYYYEDCCYLVREDVEGVNSFNVQDKKWLKENNNWNKPLDPKKMSSIDFANTPPDFENIDDYLDVCKVIQSSFELCYPGKGWEYAYITLNGLESYKDYGQIILVEIHFPNSNATEYYLILYNTNCDNTVTAIEPMGGVDNFRESIIAFKEEYCGAKR